MMGLLENLDLLANGDLPKLVKVCRVSQEVLVERIRLLRSVNPKPASPVLQRQRTRGHA